MKHKSLPAMGLILAALLAVSAPASEMTFTLQDHLGGTISAIARSGNYILAAQGRTITTFDPSGAFFQRKATYYLPPPNVADGILCDGGKAYVYHSGDRILRIFDASDPLRLQEFGNIIIGQKKQIRDIANNGLYVYVAQDSEGVRIIDASNPAQMSDTGFFPGITGAALDVFVDGSRAYVIAGHSSKLSVKRNVLIYNVASPTVPVFLGSIAVFRAREIAASGNIACTAGNYSDFGLHSLDVSDPAKPVVADSLNPISTTGGVQIQNNKAYYAINNRLLIANVTNPRDITQLGEKNLFPAILRDLEVQNSVVYVAATNSAEPLQKMDVANPANIVQVSWLKEPSSIEDATVEGSNLWLTDGNLWHYDMADPNNPILLNCYVDTKYSSITRLLKKGNHLYGLTGYNGTLQIIDCSNLSSLKITGTWTKNANAPEFRMRQDMAYLMGTGSLDIIDCSNKAGPVKKSTLATSGTNNNISAPDSSNLVFLTFKSNPNSGGFQIIDAANPTNPALLHNQPLSYLPKSICVQQNAAVVAGTQGSNWILELYDLTNPMTPQLIAQTSGSGNVWQMQIPQPGLILFSDPTGHMRSFTYNIVGRQLLAGPVCDIPNPCQFVTLPILSAKSLGMNTLSAAAPGYEINTAVYVISGYVYEDDNKSVYGYKGLYDLNLRGRDIPVLTLSASAVSQAFCPSDSTLQEEGVAVFPMALSASEEADWQATSIRIQGSGENGDEAIDIASVKLYSGKVLLDSARYGGNDGFVDLKINRVIPAGSVLALSLVYRFSQKAIEGVFPKYFRLQTKVGWVGAEPLNYLFPEFEKQPPEPKFSGPVVLAPVWNAVTLKGFNKIQQAIDDPETTDYHLIEVCPGDYEEQVVVYKPLTIRSRKGAEVTAVHASKYAVFQVQQDSTILEGFTISGNTIGVLASSSGTGKSIIRKNIIKDNTCGIRLDQSKKVQIEDNRIDNNKDGVQIIQASDNIVSNNVVASNELTGICILGKSSQFNRITGNKIGTTIDGNTAAANGAGIVLSAGGSNDIGGSEKGEGNIISGNKGHGIAIGISISRTGTDMYTDTGQNKIRGNRIGSNSAGTDKIPNTGCGIWIEYSNGNFIGGLASGSGNLISGNKGAGIVLRPGECQGTVIQNNRIGTNASGDAAMGNGGSGILVSQGTSQNTMIGGTLPGSMNLISGNAQDGISIFSEQNIVQGNYIGTDVMGKSAIPNLNGLSIILSGTVGDNLVGGSGSSSRNLISGNGANGVLISSSGYNKIQGNYIGAGQDGKAALGNQGHGILIEEFLSVRNHIGGSIAEGNIIAHNGASGGGDGICIKRGIYNFISHNLIYDNKGLGIDLGDDGISFNDAGDADDGANRLQNYPLITALSSAGGQTKMEGILLSAPSTLFKLQLYGNRQITNPQAEELLQDLEVHTDATGQAFFQTQLPGAWPSIVAIASDPDSNTSELSSSGLVVNITGDEPDANPGDGHGDVDLSAAGDQCSFRAALQEAEKRPGKDYIFFAIPGGGTPVVILRSPLPVINESVAIEGTSQPGSGYAEITGLLAGQAAAGLDFTADQCIVSGLMLREFQCPAIRLAKGKTILRRLNCVENKGAGLWLSSNAKEIKIEDCQFNQNTPCGIYSQEGALLFGNRVQTSGNKKSGQTGAEAGAGIFGGQLYLSEFICKDNEGDGIRVPSAAPLWLDKSSVSSNNGFGIYTRGAIYIDGSQVSSNGRGGIVAATLLSTFGFEAAGNKKGSYSGSEAGDGVHLTQRGQIIRAMLHDNLGDGVQAQSLQLIDSELRSNQGYGIICSGRLDLWDSKVMDNGNGGVVAQTIIANGNVQASGNRFGESGYGDGMHAGIISSTHGQIIAENNSGDGVDCDDFITYQMRSWNNDGFGVLARKSAKLYSGIIGENGLSGVYSEGMVNCLDCRIGTNGRLAQGEGDGIHAANVKLTDCNIFYNNRHGVYSSSDVIYSRGRVYSNEGWGIVLRGTPHIEQVAVYDNGQGGVGILKGQKAANHIEQITEEGSIVSSSLHGNKGDGLLIETGALDITNNNFYGNQGFAISSAVPISADGNWWGAVNGPGGSGQGSGDEVSPLVSYRTWLKDIVALTMSVETDSLMLAAGVSDTVALRLQAFKPDLPVRIMVQDDLGWYKGEAEFQLVLQDTVQVDTSLVFIPAANGGKNISDTVRVQAMSTQNGKVLATLKFAVHAYQPELKELTIVTDSFVILPFSRCQFKAQGRDQQDRLVDVQMQWKATGGSIDSSGLFIAGADTGRYEISARYLLSSFSISCSIWIVSSEITLQQPTMSKTDVSTLPEFVWYPHPSTTAFRLLIAADSAMTQVLVDTVLTANSCRPGQMPGEKTLYWQVQASTFDSLLLSPVWKITTLPTLVASEMELPETWSLAQNYPNPFNPETRIEYRLAESSRVLLQIFNLHGQLLQVLAEGIQQQGIYRLKWQPQNKASGLYFMRLQAEPIGGREKFICMKKMMIIK